LARPCAPVSAVTGRRNAIATACLRLTAPVCLHRLPRS
jgi:hypothetical protein